MKTIIAGSRRVSGSAISHVYDAVKLSGFCITEVVSGTAHGIDRAGEAWSRLVEVPLTQFPANWDKFGKSAGYIRNKQMAEYADALIAVWDGVSKGTHHMIKSAEENGLQIYIHRIGEYK